MHLMIQTAAIIYILIVFLVIVFQFCLIGGAPWGRITQGGRYQGALPYSGRVAAGFSALLLVFMAVGVASEAGMITTLPKWIANTGLAIQSLSAILNWITPSRAERLLWGPITTIMLLLAAYVAI